MGTELVEALRAVYRGTLEVEAGQRERMQFNPDHDVQPWERMLDMTGATWASPVLLTRATCLAALTQLGAPLGAPLEDPRPQVQLDNDGYVVGAPGWRPVGHDWVTGDPVYSNSQESAYACGDDEMRAVIARVRIAQPACTQFEDPDPSCSPGDPPALRRHDPGEGEPDPLPAVGADGDRPGAAGSRSAAVSAWWSYDLAELGDFGGAQTCPICGLLMSVRGARTADRATAALTRMGQQHGQGCPPPPPAVRLDDDGRVIGAPDWQPVGHDWDTGDPVYSNGRETACGDDEMRAVIARADVP